MGQATSTVEIEVDEAELKTLICGYIRDSYGYVVEPGNIKFDDLSSSVSAIVQISKKIEPKMGREMRPPSNS